MSYIELIDYTKIYSDGTKAVDSISIRTKDDEFLVLLGSSGCGKSTLLRMIAGLEPVTQGNIYIDDINSDKIDPQDRDVAMVFQDYALYPHMTVFDNMAFPLKMRRVNKREIKTIVEKTAELLQITDYLKRMPKQLSGGQQQRVAIGRAIVRKPKIFLFDEPLSNLDAALRDQMRNELVSLHKQIGGLFIYVTHDQNEAMLMGDRIIVMNQGRIIQIDTPEMIYSTPNCRLVAEFIGMPKMNFLSVDTAKRLCNNITTPTDASINVGIRPEHIKISLTTQEKAIGKVHRIDSTGKESSINFEINGETVVASIRNDECPFLRVGDFLNCTASEGNIHLFNNFSITD